MNINEMRRIKSIEATRMMLELPKYRRSKNLKNNESSNNDIFRSLLKKECGKLGVNLEEVEKQYALSKQRARVSSK